MNAAVPVETLKMGVGAGWGARMRGRLMEPRRQPSPLQERDSVAGLRTWSRPRGRKRRQCINANRTASAPKV